MLRIAEIYEIIKKIDFLYRKYYNSYNIFRRETLINGSSVKYSAGGAIYPFGKYFFAKSQIFKKAAKQSSGHFCKTLNEANFAYIFSNEGNLLAINQMFDAAKNLDGYVDYTSFLVYDTEKIYILKYGEYRDKPFLHEIGIMYSKNNFELMVHSDAPCSFVTIVIIDHAENKEYLYSIGRELFAAKYSLTSNEIYSDVWSIVRRNLS